MRFHEIEEARRNPEQNPRQETGHDGAVLKLREYSRDELKRIGISMTIIDKIGVNPRSIYNTPNGVYFYPADYYLELKGKRNAKALPFMDDAPNIQIFKFPEPVLFLDTYTEMDYSRDIKKLAEALDKVPGLVNKFKKKFIYNRELSVWAHNLVKQSDNKYITDNSIGFETYFNYLGEKSATVANVQSSGGILWYVTWQLCQDLSDVLNSRAANIWNWVLREALGYNTVVDYEQGIIYPDEPTQGVVLQTSAIQLIASISNQTPIADLRSELENMSWAKITDLYEKKRISIHDVRKNVLADARFPSGYSKLIWYLTDIDPNWQYGRNLLVKNFAENRYNIDNAVADFMRYFKRHPQRWPEVEPLIAAGPSIYLPLWYAENVLKGRWPAIEPKLISYLDSPPDPRSPRYEAALDYAITHKIRLPQDAEILLALMAKRYDIKSQGERADYAYARKVINDYDPKTWHRRVISDVAKQEQTS